MNHYKQTHSYLLGYVHNNLSSVCLRTEYFHLWLPPVECVNLVFQHNHKIVMWRIVVQFNGNWNNCKLNNWKVIYDRIILQMWNMIIEACYDALTYCWQKSSKFQITISWCFSMHLPWLWLLTMIMITNTGSTNRTSKLQLHEIMY